LKSPDSLKRPGRAAAYHPGAVGASRTFVGCGVVCLIAAAVFARMLPRLRNLVRPIYVEKGILPEEVAAGIESGTEVVADVAR
jgi:hypothetical protein